MPRHLIPKRSGVHRAACFALYRALLRQSSLLPFAEQQQSTLRHSIERTFRKHADLQSPKRITVVLQAGYDALELLGKATRGDARLVSRIGNLISALPAPPSSDPARKASDLSKVLRGPRVWPFPGAKPVLSRPYPGPLSGRRHVPKLVYAQGLPILRFKKPQSPYLSRVIHDKAKDYQKVVLRLQELERRLADVRQEDGWDDLVSHFCGRKNSDGNERNDPRWTSEVSRAIAELTRKLRVEKEARSQRARDMYRIVVAEKKLAEAEKLQWRHEKKKAKRLAKAEEAMQTASLG